MITREFFATRKDGVNLYLSKSTEGVMLHKVGTEEYYSEAIDVENAPFEYEETTIKIEEGNNEIKGN